MIRTIPPLVIIGCGGHAKVVAESFLAAGDYQLIGCTGSPTDRRGVLGLRYLGDDSALPEIWRSGVRHAFVALGDCELRLSVARDALGIGFDLANAINPRATISPTARLGRGIAVMAEAVINAEAKINDLAIVNTGAVVDHDCDIGEAAHVAPRVALAGNVRIGHLAFLGIGVCAIPGVSVGDAAVVGAGAVIVRDVPAHSVAVGVPARVIRQLAARG